MQGNMAQEAIKNTYVEMLSLLFYNTCKCLLKKDSANHKLNPKYHRKKCPYRLKVEEAKLEFEDD